MAQDGKFYAGVVGFPLRITIIDSDAAYVIPEQIPVADIETATLEIRRPDGTEFDVDLNLNDAIVTHAIEYNFVEGDVPTGGRYHYTLTLFCTLARELPVSGSFNISEVIPDDV